MPKSDSTVSKGKQIIRVLVADDHAFITDAISQNLEASGEFKCSTAHDLAAALAIIETNDPFHVVLLDYRMPGMNGLDGLRAALRMTSGRPVGILTGGPVRPLAEDVIAAGGSGLISKTMHARTIVNAIRVMALGEVYVPRSSANTMTINRQTADFIPLTPKEEAVLLEMSFAKGNKEIAETLNLKEATVKSYVKNICKKLRANNRMKAVLNAQDIGLI